MNTDDDVLETPLKVRFLTDNTGGPIPSPSISSTSQYTMREAVRFDDVGMDVEAQGQRHGFNGNEEKAACVLSKQPYELIDCLRCIQDSLCNVLSQLQQENHAHDADLLDSLYRKVNLAGPNGITAEVVKVRPLDLRYPVLTLSLGIIDGPPQYCSQTLDGPCSRALLDRLQSFPTGSFEPSPTLYRQSLPYVPKGQGEGEWSFIRHYIS